MFLGRILKAVAEMTGLVYNTAQDVTVAALRYMLAYLWTNLASQANRALGQAHRER